jgi:hypothetical protein
MAAGISDEDAKEAVTKAIAGGQGPTIHDISIATGLMYAQVVRIVLKGLASHTYRLEVNERDGVADRKTVDRFGGKKPDTPQPGT